MADLVWERFGNVPNYIEPFFGSGAVLLARPGKPGIETVNDKDGFVCNAWRAIAADPEQTARWADWPVNENDLHARHVWLRERRAALSARLEADPAYYDAQIAGWWLWGMACWIGSGFCSDSSGGPWQVVDGQLVRLSTGRGVHRKQVHLGDTGRGVHRKQDLLTWFMALQERLRYVRVCCGDWSRICGYSPTVHNGVTGVFLDPPYSAEAGRDNNLYQSDDLSVAHAVREWAIANGDNPKMRIALCGYEGEHAMPDSWECVRWKTRGGYGNQGGGRGRNNAGRERIWFSPFCLRTTLDFASSPKLELVELEIGRSDGNA